MDTTALEKSINDVRDLVLLHGTACADLEENEDNPLAGLTEMERRFVEGYAALAGSHGALTNAARYAGYSPKTCSVKGSQMIRKPKILAALRYLTEHKAHSSAILAMTTLTDLMRSGNDSVRLKAADRVLGYAGIIVKTISKVEHNINDNRTPAQIRATIAEKAQRLGINVADMVDITPPKRPSNNPDGAPSYKRQLVPNKPMDDLDIDEIDWVNVETNSK